MWKKRTRNFKYFLNIAQLFSARLGDCVAIPVSLWAYREKRIDCCFQTKFVIFQPVKRPTARHLARAVVQILYLLNTSPTVHT